MTIVETEGHLANLQHRAKQVRAWVNRVQDMEGGVHQGHMRGYIKRRWPELGDQQREQILAETVEMLTL